jgi:DNA-binding transcriptional ArsR family regulator
MGASAATAASSAVGGKRLKMTSPAATAAKPPGVSTEIHRATVAADLDARFFRGLGDPTRLRIVQLLLDGERTVSEIVREVGGLQGRISSHLMCLRWCGYVTTRREGKWVYYAVTDPRVREILRLAQSMRRDHAESLAACAVIGPAEPGAPA